MRPGLFLLITAFLAALAAGAAMAQGYPGRGTPYGDAAYTRAVTPGARPLDSILPAIRRSHPGQFYDADGPTPGPNGSLHYHLKWMTPDGRIEWLDTDARTGRVLSASPGRDNFDGPGAQRYFPRAPSYPVPQPFAGRGAFPPGVYGGPLPGGFGPGGFGNRQGLGHDGFGRGGYGGGGGGGWRGRGRNGR